RSARSPSFTVTRSVIRCRFMAHSMLASRLCREAWLQDRGCEFRTRLPAPPAGLGLSPRDAGRTRTPAAPERGRTADPGLARRYPPRRKAGVTASGADEKPLSQSTGPRLKRASGPLQLESAWK